MHESFYYFQQPEIWFSFFHPAFDCGVWIKCQHGFYLIYDLKSSSSWDLILLYVAAWHTLKWFSWGDCTILFFNETLPRSMEPKANKLILLRDTFFERWGLLSIFQVEALPENPVSNINLGQTNSLNFNSVTMFQIAYRHCSHIKLWAYWSWPRLDFYASSTTTQQPVTISSIF